jgi:uncharacterized protein (UPF0261 family)
LRRIYVVGTADTKGEELAYLAGVLESLGQIPVLVDVGTRAPSVTVDVPAREVATHAPDGADAVLGTDDRGNAMVAMGEAFRRYIVTCKDVAGVIGIGGGGGTSIVTAGMRELPLGMPKVMVSTLASGDVAPYVGVSDIVMMPSVTDLAGLNRLSRVILHNAAAAVAGMCTTSAPAAADKPPLGLTMFGVTTPAVTAIVERLKDDYDCLVFHATGTGGRAMEKLVASDMLVGVLDITTTEICDHLCGGVLSAGEGRLDVIARAGVPYVGSVGALDMVNFWSFDSVPEACRERLLYRHNPNVTLMRTTAEECRTIGSWLAAKLNRMRGPVRFLIPEQGVSALDVEGGAFFDPDADAALFAAIEDGVEWSHDRRLIRLACHLNEPAFADAAVAAYREIAR